MSGVRRQRAVTTATAVALVLAGAVLAPVALSPSASAQTTPSLPGVTTPAPAPPTTQDPGENGDAPPQSVPQTPDTVPSKQDGTAPRARTVQVDASTAQQSVTARIAALQEATSRRQQLEASVADLQATLTRLAGEGRAAVQNLLAAHDDLVARATDAYVRGGEPDDTWALDDGNLERTALLSAIADRDRGSIARYEAARAKVTRDQATAADQLSSTQSQLDQARVDEAQAQADLFDARFALRVTSAGGKFVIEGFVFPVASPHSFSEDFGDPRLPGTPQAHTHQGCDVVAAEGTELYAAERGVITQIGVDDLGGNGIWLKGESNTSYYYAHLSRYADGLHVGQVVDAGQLVGYVGHTGDAYGPHLHFEVHPNGGPAIDPYPILLASDPDSQPKP